MVIACWRIAAFQKVIPTGRSPSTRLCNTHPKELVVSKNYIQLLHRKNRVDEADKLNEALRKSRMRDREALVFRGEIQLWRGKVNEAIQTLQPVIANNPDLAVAHDQLGRALNQLGEPDEPPNGSRLCAFNRP